jgi:hypothetical protein
MIKVSAFPAKRCFAASVAWRGIGFGGTIGAMLPGMTTCIAGYQIGQFFDFTEN